MNTMGPFSGAKRLKPAADHLLQRLRMNVVTSPFPICSCVTCKGTHCADEGLKQSFRIAVDWNRKLEALPYLCLSTLSVVKIYELEAEREGCVSRCSEIDRKMCPGRKKIEPFRVSSVFRVSFVFIIIYYVQKSTKRIVNYGPMALTPLTCSGQQKLSGLLLSYSLLRHWGMR
jgi:hypothetical protein